MTEKRERKAPAALALFVALCICFGAVFVRTIRADEESYFFPTLYCNDEMWYKCDIYPLDKYYQSDYIPAVMLEHFDGISVTENESFGTLLITYNSVSGVKFISFDLEADSAVTHDKKEFNNMMTYTKDDERYVPVRAVCDTLGLSIESYTSEKTAQKALRICDGKQKKSFSEMVAVYDPQDSSSVTDPDDPDVTTEPPVTEPIPPIDARTIYLTFDSIDTGVMDEILEKLRAHNKRATFFLTDNEMSADDSDFIKLFSSGHSIGFAFDTSGYEVGCVATFDFQNKYLMRVLKTESHFARICGERDTEQEINAAIDAQYAVWDWNLSLEANNTSDISANIAELEKAAVQNDILVIRFVGNAYCAEMLDKALDYIDSEMTCSARTINDATQNDYLKK